MNDATPLYIQIKNRLRQRVMSFTAADRLPSTKILAQEYHVGKHTITRALSLLVDENLICRIRHRGTVRTSCQDLQDPQRNSRSLGMVFPSPDLDGWQDSFDAMQRVAQQNGFSFEIYLYVPSVPGDLQRKIQRARKQCVGIGIYVDNDKINPATELISNCYPVVIYGQQFEGDSVSAVYADNIPASRALTTTFLQRGLTRIALFFEPIREASYVRQRIAGWRLAYRQAGLAPDENLIFFTTQNWQNDFPSYLQEHRPQAIIFSNSGETRQKVGAFLANSSLGRIPCAAFVTPSSVREHPKDGTILAELPGSESGQAITEMLISQIQHPGQPSRKIALGIRIFDN